MDTIKAIIAPYVELECEIRELMGHLCSDACGMCTACCCRVDICEETVQSAFLRLLIKQLERSTEDLDDRYGWLGLQGCSLDFGRPPICYAYFCDELMARLPDEETRWIIRVLGRLLHSVGENAITGCHLVEIEDEDALHTVDLDRISKRIGKAQSACRIIQQYFETGRLTTTDRARLETFPVDEL